MMNTTPDETAPATQRAAKGLGENLETLIIYKLDSRKKKENKKDLD